MQASGCGWSRPLLDLRVSVTGGVHFDLVKRVLRDISRSGQAPEEIIQQARHVALPALECPLLTQMGLRPTYLVCKCALLLPARSGASSNRSPPGRE